MNRALVEGIKVPEEWTVLDASAAPEPGTGFRKELLWAYRTATGDPKQSPRAGWRAGPLRASFREGFFQAVSRKRRHVLVF